MLPHRIEARTPQTSRGPFFWAAVSSLAVAQLVAFWMLCNEQVRKAEMREVAVPVTRVATAPSAVPNNLLASSAKPRKGDAPAPMSNAVHVTYTVR